MRKDFTLNFGMRYAVQLPFVALNDSSATRNNAHRITECLAHAFEFLARFSLVIGKGGLHTGLIKNMLSAVDCQVVSLFF